MGSYERKAEVGGGNASDKDVHLAYGDSACHDSEGEQYCNFKISAESELFLTLRGSMRAQFEGLTRYVFARSDRLDKLDSVVM